MHDRRLHRALPALCVAALLALAMAAPSRRSATPAPSPLFQPACDSYVSAAGGDSTIESFPGHGIVQPFTAGMTAASCSLTVASSSVNYVTVDVVEWDPLALAPDPRSLALRTTSVDPSRLEWAGGLAIQSFVPPVVTRSVDHVAEPPRLTAALRMTSAGYGIGVLSTTYDPASSAALPGALQFTGSGAATPLPGTHPVLAHAICGGGDDVQSLRVVQSVMHANGVPTARGNELAQRFRVPEPVELHWVELAEEFTGEPANVTTGADGGRTPNMGGYPSSVVAILDGATLPAPVPKMPSSLVEALLPPDFTASLRWVSHDDFDYTIDLYPGHDYWLYVRSTLQNRFQKAVLTGTEGPDWTSAIGPYWERDYASGIWGQVTGSVLAFRLIGRPLADLGTPRPSSGVGGLHVRVAPNPGPGVVDAIWSGGVGPVRLELLDARGRRVARADGGAAGTWHWSGLGARGQPVPAGVYFLDARDSQGGHAVERVVIVR